MALPEVLAINIACKMALLEVNGQNPFNISLPSQISSSSAEEQIHLG